MNTRDVPACMRIPFDVALANAQGFKWGAGGLSRDCNPHFPYGTERRLAVAWDEGWYEGAGALERQPKEGRDR